LLHPSLYAKVITLKSNKNNMNLRRIKHMFLRLSPEEKIIGAGGLLVIMGLFMPWYSVVMSFDKKSVTYSGFSGDLGVIGFVIFIMTILALFVLIAEYLHIRLPRINYTKEQILFFLMGQSSFLVLLLIAIYTKRSLDFTEAELRFGIYLVLIGAAVSAFSSFSQIQKFKRKDVEEFFEHEESAEPKHKKAKHELEEEVVQAEEEVIEEPEEEQALFEDNKEAEILEEDTVQHEYEEPEQEEEIIEEEVAEEIKEDAPEEALEAETEDILPENETVETRRGASQDEDEEENKGKKGKGSTLSMNFYED